MKKDNNDFNPQFPLEMPDKHQKQSEGSVIEAVVREHVEPASATNPASYSDTDSLNTEFAKKAQSDNLNN